MPKKIGVEIFADLNQGSLQQVEKKLNSIEDEKVNIDLDVDNSIRVIEDKLNRLKDSDVNIRFQTSGEDPDEIERKLQAIADEQVDIKFNTTGESLSEIERRLDAISDEVVEIRIQPTGDTPEQIEKQIDAIKDEVVDIRFTTSGQSIPALENQIQSIKDTTVDIKIETSGDSISSIENQLRNLPPAIVSFKTDDAQLNTVVNTIREIPDGDTKIKVDDSELDAAERKIRNMPDADVKIRTSRSGGGGSGDGSQGGDAGFDGAFDAARFAAMVVPGGKVATMLASAFGVKQLTETGAQGIYEAGRENFMARSLGVDSRKFAQMTDAFQKIGYDVTDSSEILQAMSRGVGEAIENDEQMIVDLIRTGLIKGDVAYNESGDEVVGQHNLESIENLDSIQILERFLEGLEKLPQDIATNISARWLGETDSLRARAVDPDLAFSKDYNGLNLGQMQRAEDLMSTYFAFMDRSKELAATGITAGADFFDNLWADITGATPGHSNTDRDKDYVFGSQSEEDAGVRLIDVARSLGLDDDHIREILSEYEGTLSENVSVIMNQFLDDAIGIYGSIEEAQANAKTGTENFSKDAIDILGNSSSKSALDFEEKWKEAIGNTMSRLTDLANQVRDIGKTNIISGPSGGGHPGGTDPDEDIPYGQGGLF